MHKPLNRRAGARLIALAAAGAVVAAPIAAATASSPSAGAAKTTKTTTKTYALPRLHSRTVTQNYPLALRFPRAKYRCTVKVPRGVAILSKTNVLGGSACRVKVDNLNLVSRRFKVTTSTTY